MLQFISIVLPLTFLLPYSPPTVMYFVLCLFISPTKPGTIIHSRRLSPSSTVRMNPLHEPSLMIYYWLTLCSYPRAKSHMIEERCLLRFEMYRYREAECASNPGHDLKLQYLSGSQSADWSTRLLG